jgi:ectoine hydroxylase-related dioxygenase (phytanoyl-CoA dioxygenase family)
MTKRLTQEQVDAYHRDGFLFPVTAMTPAEASAYRAEMESFEERIGTRLTKADAMYRSRSYLLFDWAQRLVRHPAILDAVEDVIGPDILVYTSTWFIKEPGSDAITAWHQDATHFGLDPNDVHVTAWIALSDATNDSGCMQFIPRSTEEGQRRHKLGLRSSINNAGQFIPGSFDESELADCSLMPGQFSLHNTLLVHRSGPNLSSDRRIGLGISYVPASVRHVGSARVPAHLVRGEDRYGHFDLDPAPDGDFTDAAVALHASSYRRWQNAYAAETDRHQAQQLAAE